MKSKKHKKHDDRHKSGYGDSQYEHRPLKLVLKVGSSSSSNNIAIAKKKKKSKKHKHKHHRYYHSKSSSPQHNTSGEQPSVAPILIKTHTIPNDVHESIPSKSPPTPQLAFTGEKIDSNTQFNQFLGNLLKMLQKRDTYDFFGSPVTDTIAPDYSSIISHPMDFSTMKKKIDQDIYQTMNSFRSDVKLVCDNAMVYNLPETIYYKEARKLWSYAECKIFNKNILAELAKPYPDLLPGQLEYDNEESPSMEIEPSIQTVASTENPQQGSCTDPLNLPDKDISDSSENKLSNDEELTAEQILAHVRIASDRLKRPIRSHLSFLSTKNDGTTTLNIIGNQEKEKTVTLGSLVGKLPDGVSCLPPYKEPEENRVNLIDPVPTEPFSSFLPSVDSTFANFNQEETQLLRSTYADDTSFDYIKSIISFADNSLALNTVDELLESLTDGQHRKIMSKMRDLRMNKNKENKEKEEEEKNENENENEYIDEKETKKEAYKLDLSDISSDEDKSQNINSQLLLNEFQTVNTQQSASSVQPTLPTNVRMKSTEFIGHENMIPLNSQNEEATNQPTCLDLEAIINELKLLANDC